MDLTGTLLEIGAFGCPALPRSTYPGVKILDLADTDSLRSLAVTLDIDPQSVDDVDYVMDVLALADELDAGQFRTIVACAVIEHAPDLVGFLNACAHLLAEDGQLALAVPDMRYCFDVLREPSSLGELVDASIEKRTTATTGQVIDHLYNAVRFGDLQALSSRDIEHISSAHGIDEAVSRFNAGTAGTAGTASTDDATHVGDPAVHCWQFTPEHFSRLIDALRSLGLIEFRVEKLTRGYAEFYAVLMKAERGNDTDLRIKTGRSALLERGSRSRGWL